jgi:hypothetical protein
MLRLHRLCFLLVLPIVLAAIPTHASQRASAVQTPIYLPMIMQAPPPNPFGFDLRTYIPDTALPYIRAAQPRWVRAGDVMWSDIEPVRGVYHWEAMAAVEANIARLRAIGIEPTLVIQRTPAWAQRIPGRLCSPPKPEYLADYERFTRALAARYLGTVNYWEVGNETDFMASEVYDSQGVGCWADPALPYHGGAYYGQALMRVAAAIKSGNPGAQVIGGALMYRWPDDTVSRDFLSGMLAAGAGGAIDALSFHAYGEWGAGDLLIAKTTHMRQVLAAYGHPNLPLFATEIAATCQGDTLSSCLPDFQRWKTKQANYAARIYAEALALNLKGAFWYTLAIPNPGASFSHLIDVPDNTLTPRPAYYAFANSAQLLHGAHYTGPPIQEPAPDQIHKVQVLTFRKANSTLYVLWVPQIDFPAYYELPVTPGAQAICTDHLDQNPPTIYYCSDTNKDGAIPRAVNELPQYIEVFQ